MPELDVVPEVVTVSCDVALPVLSTEVVQRISADNKMRQRVLSARNIIHLHSGIIQGEPPCDQDRVIRVIPLQSESIDLSTTPGKERWTQIREVISSHADRNKPVPKPLAVSPSIKEGWNVDLEDVPTVYLQGFSNVDKKEVVVSESKRKRGRPKRAQSTMPLKRA